eukprot:sb/3479676/
MGQVSPNLLFSLREEYICEDRSQSRATSISLRHPCGQDTHLLLKKVRGEGLFCNHRIEIQSDTDLVAPDLVAPRFMTTSLSPEDVTKSGSDCIFEGRSPSRLYDCVCDLVCCCVLCDIELLGGQIESIWYQSFSNASTPWYRRHLTLRATFARAGFAPIITKSATRPGVSDSNPHLLNSCPRIVPRGRSDVFFEGPKIHCGLKYIEQSTVSDVLLRLLLQLPVWERHRSRPRILCLVGLGELVLGGFHRLDGLGTGTCRCTRKQMLVICLLAVWTAVHANVDEESMIACHTGDRFGLWCEGYVNLVIHENDEVTFGRSKRWAEFKRNKRAADMMGMMGKMMDMEMMGGKPDQMNGNITGIDFPELDDDCFDLEWGNGSVWNRGNDYGNCMEMYENGTHRFISTNSVPDYPVAPYCPNGIGEGYCTFDDKSCPLLEMICGHPDNGPGTTTFGDVPFPTKHHFIIPLEGNPTRSDRPGDMFDAVSVGAAKTLGPTLGVIRNGVGIHGPNDGGDVTIDKAGYQLPCGPVYSGGKRLLKCLLLVSGPRNPPLYHYHKAPDCIEEFRKQAWGLAYDGTPNKHAPLIGWAIDGFGIYGYEDVDGSNPVLDECGGHFGPTDTDLRSVLPPKTKANSGCVGFVLKSIFRNTLFPISALTTEKSCITTTQRRTFPTILRVRGQRWGSVVRCKRALLFVGQVVASKYAYSQVRAMGAAKTLGPTLGVIRNGVGIHGPNDGGDVTIDKAGYQLPCGGHMSPPFANNFTNENHRGPRNPPLYHYHKAPDCIEEFRKQAWGLAYDGTPNKHAPLIGWAIDGFGIYGYEDVDGSNPVLDECGGHFGPTDTDLINIDNYVYIPPISDRDRAVKLLLSLKDNLNVLYTDLRSVLPPKTVKRAACEPICLQLQKANSGCVGFVLKSIFIIQKHVVPYFGVDDFDREVVYEYHATDTDVLDVPYYVICLLPVLGKVSKNVKEESIYGTVCGLEVGLQPGTSEERLTKYLEKWEEGYVNLVKYENNEVNSGRSIYTAETLAAVTMTAILWVRNKKMKNYYNMYGVYLDENMEGLPDKMRGNITGILVPELLLLTGVEEEGNGKVGSGRAMGVRWGILEDSFGWEKGREYEKCCEIRARVGTDRNKYTTYENGLFRSRDWLSQGLGGVFPYCPNGIGEGYCTFDDKSCPLLEMVVGHPNNGPGRTLLGEVPDGEQCTSGYVPTRRQILLPLEGNPTRSDRVGDMFDAVSVGAAKSLGPTLGVIRNGVGIHVKRVGPNDGGDVTIDKAGY